MSSVNPLSQTVSILLYEDAVRRSVKFEGIETSQITKLVFREAFSNIETSYPSITPARNPTPRVWTVVKSTLHNTH